MTNEDLDLVATIYGTDLYGLLNILLKETGKEEDFINELNKVRALFTEVQDEE